MLQKKQVRNEVKNSRKKGHDGCLPPKSSLGLQWRPQTQGETTPTHCGWSHPPIVAALLIAFCCSFSPLFIRFYLLFKELFGGSIATSRGDFRARFNLGLAPKTPLRRNKVGRFGFKLTDFKVHPSNLILCFLLPPSLPPPPLSISLFHVYSCFLLFEHVSLDYVQLKYLL